MAELPQTQVNISIKTNSITTFSPELLKIKLPTLNYEGCFLAGGAVRDSLIGERPSDFDIFGKDESLKLFEKTNFGDEKPYFSNGLVNNFKKDGNKIQVCYRNLAMPADFINYVDYSICQFTFDGKDIYTTPEALISTFTKRLIVKNIHKEFAVDSLRRLQKYIQKGYSICDGGLKDLVNAVRKLKDEDVKNQFEFYQGSNNARVLRFD